MLTVLVLYILVGILIAGIGFPAVRSMAGSDLVMIVCLTLFIVFFWIVVATAHIVDPE